jgi:hypothetical protein
VYWREPPETGTQRHAKLEKKIHSAAGEEKGWKCSMR